MNAAPLKEEAAAKAGSPPGARKRRAVNRGRADYATINAMADLQYALSTGAPMLSAVSIFPL
jgi:hypothetical protein